MSGTAWMIVLLIILIPIFIVGAIKFIQFIINEIKICQNIKRKARERQETIRQLKNNVAGLGHYPDRNDRLP